MSQQPIEEEEPFARIDAVKAKELHDTGTTTWVDVRKPDEVAREGRIPGTRLVPMDELLANPWRHLKVDNVVFVCSEGIRSALACDLAAAVGLTTIYNLEGGVLGWAAQGFPIEKPIPPEPHPAGRADAELALEAWGSGRESNPGSVW